MRVAEERATPSGAQECIVCCSGPNGVLCAVLSTHICTVCFALAAALCTSAAPTAACEPGCWVGCGL